MRYTIKHKGEAVAQTTNGDLADAIVDILCGVAEKGDTVELLDGDVVILGFDRDGRPYSSRNKMGATA
jgi:hypothetical protein